MKKLKKREAAYMCDKLKEIHRMTPNNILEKYWSNQYPVDMISLLQRINIPCFGVEFDQLEKALHMDKQDCILGLAFSKGNDLNILYSNKLNNPSRNYILAHELAHCCLHMKPTSEFHIELKRSFDIYSDIRKTVSSKKILRDNSNKELEADIFAVDLLLPDTIRSTILTSKSEKELNDYAKKFDVPQDVLKLKISMSNSRLRGEKYDNPC